VPEQGKLIISRPRSFTALGDYTILVRGQLNNELKTSSQTNFTLSIVTASGAPTKNQTVPLEAEVSEDVQKQSPFNSWAVPEFRLDLEDLVVTVGHSLTQQLGFSSSEVGES